MKKSLLIIACVTSFVLFSGGAWGATFCVDPGGGGDYTNLQDALTVAQSNDADDVINVVQGTYTGNFTYVASKSYSINLYGGFTAGCADWADDPAKTILDGGGSGRTLELDNTTSTGIASGNIKVGGFTIRNGSGVSYGGGLYAQSRNDSTDGNQDSGAVTISKNIIKQNSASTSGGGLYALSTTQDGASGNVNVSNNIIAGNSATNNYAGGAWVESSSQNSTAGDVSFVHNTVTGNTANSSGGGVYFYIYGTSGGILNVYNNIIRGNTTTTLNAEDLTISALVANGYNNNYNDFEDTWDSSGGNINLDPKFVGSGNYHLLSTSPCIDTGNNSVLTEDADIDGNERIINGTVDMGADEYNPAADKNDFNTDGISDILLRNASTGQHTLWYMNDDGSHTGKSLLTNQSFTIVGTGDFNVDGVSDILWTNTATGQHTLWYMKANGTRTGKNLLTNTSWSIVGTGDINGDGIYDILWTNTSTGQHTVWYMKADGSRTSKTLLNNANWTIASTGDINGDGISDILWSNTSTGQHSLWFMQTDGSHTTKVLLTSTAWAIVGTGDYNNDGLSDILWRKISNGSHVLWFMNADGTQSGNKALLMDTNMVIAGTGDYNKDGLSDILWSNTSTGQHTIWYMNDDGTSSGSKIILTNAAWTIVP